MSVTIHKPAWKVRYAAQLCRAFGIDMKLLLAPHTVQSSKSWAVVSARQCLCFLLYGDLRNFKAVARIVGRNHATVIHSVGKHDDYMNTDQEYKERFHHAMRLIGKNKEGA